jgi:hypothetical protein
MSTAHQAGGGLETISLTKKLAFRFKEIDQLFGIQILSGTSVKPRLDAEFSDDVFNQRGFRVGLAGIEHHLHDFMTVNTVHFLC